jgi:hypothetical protein
MNAKPKRVHAPKLTRLSEFTEDLRALIFADDRSVIETVCIGPDESGECPRAVAGHPVDCADKWIINKGWNFKVARDAETCPLVSLGLAHRYLLATIGTKERGHDQSSSRLLVRRSAINAAASDRRRRFSLLRMLET